MGFRIAGTGHCLPETIYTNDDLAKMVDTSDEWIVTRTGIHERHIAKGETTADIAEQAARQALAQSGIAPADLGLIICATITPDAPIPSLACTMQHRLGALGAAAFDINAACTGFLYALNVARGWLTGDPRPALIIGAERLSSITNWQDRTTCVLFGDGAGAVTLLPDEAPVWIECAAEPDIDRALALTGPNRTVAMEGQAVYKFATRAFVDRLSGVLARAGMVAEQLKWIVPHQANARIVRTAASRLNLPLSRFFMNIDRVGNTSAASVPIALDMLHRTGELLRGDWLAMAAFGGGLTSGAALMQW